MSPTSTLKHAITLAIGLPICRLPWLRSYKDYLLSTWTNPERRSKLDHFFFRAVFAYWLEREYLKEEDPDKRESMKSPLMGGDAGEVWASHYADQPIDLEERIGHMSYKEACPLLPDIDKALAAEGEPALVVQIGSSSGREIAWLAGRHPKHTFIGTDIFQKVIDYSAGKHNGANLSFRLFSAQKIGDLLESRRDERIIVFASGSLQYVQPEHLEIFFARINRFPNLRLYVLEPATEALMNTHEKLRRKEGRKEGRSPSLYAGNLSYCHDYRAYAERARMNTILCEIIRPYAPYEDFPEHRGTVHYYHQAKAAS
ncbi:MAG: class I SAM-dependent methyltransferase [Elusimicrobiota bacterium]